MKKCRICSFENDDHAFYCQNCGEALKNKFSIKRYLKSLNFGSVAGGGAKGISVAPLVGMELDKLKEHKEFMPVTKSYSLEDGSWYCPYCGKRNRKMEMQCGDCLRGKP